MTTMMFLKFGQIHSCFTVNEVLRYNSGICYFTSNAGNLSGVSVQRTHQISPEIYLSETRCYTLLYTSLDESHLVVAARKCSRFR